MNRLLLTAWAVAIFTLTYALGVRHNDFPFHYHPDEPGKVEQVIKAEWNFHHPMLLLTTTRAVVKLTGVSETEQAVVEAGRRVSAAFIGVAVVAFSLLAYLWRGWAAALAAGGALALHHQLFELAHYMKEDSALLAGVALTFLATFGFWQKPTALHAAALGAACALAISGKYLGVVVLGVALPVIVGALRKVRGDRRCLSHPARSIPDGLPIAPKDMHDAPEYLCDAPEPLRDTPEGMRDASEVLSNAPQWPRSGGIRFWISGPVISFVCGMAAVLVLVNLPLIAQLGDFHRSLGREMDFVVHGQKGTTRSVPHAQYWNVFIDNTTPAIWALLLVFLTARWRYRREMPLAGWLLAAFPFVFALALSFSPKSNDRYFLPATAVFTVLAALAVVDVPHLRHGRVPPILGQVLAALLLVGAQVPSWLRYDRAFQHDDTRELAEWLRTSLPADAVLARDSRVRLPDPTRPEDASRALPIPQRIYRIPGKRLPRYAADLGSVAELRAAGVTHVAVSESDYGRFFLESLRPRESEVDDFARRRTFYQDLFRDAKIVFERERGTVIYLHPGIRVYELGD